MKITAKTSVGAIVAQDIRKANICKQYGIDFCCGGERPLIDACRELGIDYEQIKQELERDTPIGETSALQFDNWRLDLLIDYIVKYHHHYIRTQGVETYQLLEKVCEVHGANHPELPLIKELFYQSLTDLHQHLDKEEMVLFPFIHELLQAEAEGTPLPNFHCGSIENPISVMKSEHDGEGVLHAEINKLTNQYITPPDGCASYQLLMQRLSEFEQNLHIHIHVENNILFPKSIQLQYNLSR